MKSTNQRHRLGQPGVHTNIQPMRVSSLRKWTNITSYNIQQLCPIPAGPFHAKGNITIPDEYVKQIPSIAFSIPDVPFQYVPY